MTKNQKKSRVVDLVVDYLEWDFSEPQSLTVITDAVRAELWESSLIGLSDAEVLEVAIEVQGSVDHRRRLLGMHNEDGETYLHN